MVDQGGFRKPSDNCRSVSGTASVFLRENQSRCPDDVPTPMPSGSELNEVAFLQRVNSAQAHAERSGWRHVVEN
jgi:hypothetical protein